MATSLKLTRNQLASFLKDPEQIKQFERLIFLVDQSLNSGEVTGLSDTLGSVIAATNANAAALQALRDELDRLPPSVDLSALVDRLPPTDDLSPLTDRLAGLEAAPSVDLGELRDRIGALECAPPLVVGPFSSMSWTGHPGYASGGYYFADGIMHAATPAANSANTIYFHPFVLLAATTIDSLLARVSTAAASGLFQMALYAADATTRLPTGAALYSSSSQSTTTATVIEDTAPSLALSAGLYWAAFNKDTTAAAAVFTSLTTNSLRVPQFVPAQTAAGLMASVASVLAGYSRSTTFGTWPTLTGSFSGDSLAQVTTNGIVPVIGFKSA